MKRILLIPGIKIHNANALSSPYTIGFPAMTAWLGAVHALERKLLGTEFEEIHFTAVAPVCHQADLQTIKGDGDHVYSIIGTGNPLDKNGDRPSFIEEARCHLNVSLVIECEINALIDYEEFTSTIKHLLLGKMKLAGGDILSCDLPEIIEIDDEASQRKLLRQLMPGHCLIDRRDLMRQSMKEGKDGIDALLDYLKITHSCSVDENEQVTWESHRKAKGWIVPVATGFHGISQLGKAQNQRDPDTPHRFAESVVTLGEFVMPFRITNLDHMLWHYHVDEEQNLYMCQPNLSIFEPQGE